MKYISRNLEDTSRIAEKLLAKILKTPKRKNSACIVLLSGNLGAGKTAFVKAIAKILGIKERITSPTFVLMRKYGIPEGGKLIHIDAYRLENKKELTALNWDAISRDSRNIIFLEWPEKVFTRSPRGAKKIAFKFVDEKTREINFL